MKKDVFSAGTTPGSPGTKGEIKTLICYLLSEVSEGISFSQLHESLKLHNLVNYFELIDNLSSLVKSGHIAKTTEDDIDYYKILALGQQAAKTLDNSLPYTVRDKALSSLEKSILQNQRLKEVLSSITQLSTGGFLLKLGIPQENGNLISLEIFCPTMDEAKKFRVSFINDPIYIYKTVVSLLAGDKKILGELNPVVEHLFEY